MKIRIENLSFAYNSHLPTSKTVLKNIYLEITTGEFIGLVGPSGSGKTTLLQHLTGLLRPSQGRILIDDRDLWDKKINQAEVRRRIGLVFQFPEAQLFEDRVVEDVAFGPRSLDLDELEVERRVREALDLVDIDFEKFKDRSPHQLSEGEKRRIALAGVLAMNPAILALDEPTACLDPKGVKLIEHLLKRLHTSGKAIILISHNIDLVAKLAQRLVVLKEGQILYDGPKEDLFKRENFLIKIGLEIPRIVRYLKQIEGLNLFFPKDVFSVEDARAYLKNLNHQKDTW